jgi:hypothetical protein
MELDDIDRQLEALDRSKVDVSALLDRVLGKDRSLAKLDEMLAALGEVPPGMLRPRVPSAFPPRRSPLPPRIVSGAPFSPLGQVAASSPWPPRPAPAAITPEQATAPAGPEAWPSPLHAAPAAQPVPAARPSPFPDAEAATDAMPVIASIPPLPRIKDTLVDTPLAPLPPIMSSDDDLDAETAALLGDPSMPSAVPLPFGPSVETSVSVAPAPTQADTPADTPADTEASTDVPTRVGPRPEEIEAAAQVDQERARRDSVRALLDQEIDPNDFPSERPPKPSGDDDVEMLLEDDEILEIEDDELLEDDET